MATRTDTTAELTQAEENTLNTSRGHLQAVADKLTALRDEVLNAVDDYDARLGTFDERTRNDIRSKRGG